MAKKKPQPRKNKVASRLNASQYEQLRPYFPLMKIWHENRSIINAELHTIESVSQAIGNSPTDMWCAGCKADLLDAMCKEVLRFDEETFDFVL